MEADWDEVARVAVPPPNPHVLPTTATAFAFDDLQELLWVGNEYVRAYTHTHSLSLSLLLGATVLLTAMIGSHHVVLRPRTPAVHLGPRASRHRGPRATVSVP